MRSRMSSRNHPTQPLSPKHQPWCRLQTPDRSVAYANMSKSPKEMSPSSPYVTVEQELISRAKIEQRSAERIERLHEAVSHDRFVRRLHRQRVTGQVGKIVKQEMSKASV